MTFLVTTVLLSVIFLKSIISINFMLGFLYKGNKLLKKAISYPSRSPISNFDHEYHSDFSSRDFSISMGTFSICSLSQTSSCHKAVVSLCLPINIFTEDKTQGALKPAAFHADVGVIPESCP